MMSTATPLLVVDRHGDRGGPPNVPPAPAPAEPDEGEVVGWGARAAWAGPAAWTVSRVIGRALAGLGVRDVFGVLGGGIAAFADGLTREGLRLVHTRHEAGAAFAAVEAHFASGRPAVVVVTTGPGLLNALTGVMAARSDGAKVLLVSGATSRAQLGRGAVQETGPGTLAAGIDSAGAMFHYAARPETPAEVAVALQQIARGWAGPGGFVAHLALPWSLQTQLVDGPGGAGVGAWTVTDAAPPVEVVDACLDRLAGGPAAIWVGHGARAAAAELRRFAGAAGLPVIGSPRAKGVFDEDHPLYVGASGAGGHASVPAFFAGVRPETVLVIGTRLGEVTSFLAPGGTPTRRWIHVDVDPSAFGAAFPGTDGLGVVADARRFLAALDARAGATGWYARARREPHAHHVGRPARLVARPDGDVRTPYLMQVLQDLVVDGSDAVLMSEAGNAFTWCNHALRFRRPGRYRTSAAWGSMGHFTTGAVGAALASGRKAVAVVGDGAMLMNNEVNTAVAYAAPVVWVVLNDAQLGLNEHGMQALGMAPVETQLPRTDFVAFARSQGAAGVSVEREADLPAALATALAASGPFVVDVRIDRSVQSPILALRIGSLTAQGGGGGR